MKNIGTTIERAIKSTGVVQAIDAIWGGDLAGCSGCGKMRDNLNAGMSMKDAIIERWFKNKEEGEIMQFQIQIVVEAESVVQAITPDAIAKGTIISVTPRPQQPPRPPGNISSGITVTPATGH